MFSENCPEVSEKSGKRQGIYQLLRSDNPANLSHLSFTISIQNALDIATYFACCWFFQNAEQMSLQGNDQDDQFAEDHVFDPPCIIRDSEFFFSPGCNKLTYLFPEFLVLITTSGEPFND